MPFIPVPDATKVELIYLYDDQRVQNVFHVQTVANPTPESLTLLAQEFVDWWADNVQAGNPNTSTLIAVECTSLDTATSPGIVFTGAPLPLTGGSGSPQLPNNVTIAIKWLTALRGRSFRGRTYHVGMAEGGVEGNRVSIAGATALAAAYDQLRTRLITFGSPLVVVSLFSNGVPRAQGIATPITGVFVDPVIDSQRRRLPGRGQ